MKHKKSQRRHEGPRGFEPHSLRARDHGGYRRRRSAWRIFDPGKAYVDPGQPHFRTVASMAALPGKHMRSVPEPVRAAHGKGQA